MRVDALAALVDAAGTDVAVDVARAALRRGDAVVAIHVAEGVLARDATNDDAVAVMVDAHQHLLDSGGAQNLWENGWLREQMARWTPARTKGSEA